MILRLSKGKKVNKLCKNYWINTNVNFKTKFAREKKKHTIISEISCSILA